MRPAHAAAATAIVALLSVSGFVSASCPYPLGEFAAAHHTVVWNWTGTPQDREWGIVEATLIHGQKSFGRIVNAGGQLHFLYDDEVEYELPDGQPAETQSIYYKEYSNATGWDVPLLSLASQNVSEPRPDARNVAPYATAVGVDFWAVWEVSGDPHYRVNGSYVLLRGKTAAGFTPIMPVSDYSADSSNKLAKIITVGSATYIAWQTNLGNADSLEYRLVGRSWDGSTFGPIENISAPNDQWSDQVAALATDGSRVFAGWTSQNTSFLSGEGDWLVKASVRAANGTWSTEAPLVSSTLSSSKTPAAAFYNNLLYVAWASDDPNLDSRGDFDIVMKSFDPATGSVGPFLAVSTDEFTREELDPFLYSWPVSDGGDGKLHILWSSTSTPESIQTSGSDNDIYYRTFDGAAFGAVRLVSDPLDNGFVDVFPGFFAIGDELHAYYLSNICLPGCGHETDWREMTRLLERPARWYDDLGANYTVTESAAGPDLTKATIHVWHTSGGPVTENDIYATAASGEVRSLILVGGTASVSFEYNDSAIHQLQVSYCGRDIPTADDTPAPPPPVPPGNSDGFNTVVLGALIGAALLAAFLAMRMRKR